MESLSVETKSSDSVSAVVTPIVVDKIRKISFPKKSELVVISGGASGVDRAFLRVAHKLGIKTMGYAPRNFGYDGSTCPEMKDYGLEDCKGGHSTKDKMNIDVCKPDVLMVHPINIPKTGRGTSQTRNYALYGNYWMYGEKDEKTKQEIKESLEEKYKLEYSKDKEFNIVEDGKIPVIEVWNITTNKDIAEITADKMEDVVDNIVDTWIKFKPARFMVTGMTEKVGNCETIIGGIYELAFKEYFTLLDD